ncbi:MAG: LysE family transporter [Pseudomonadota bacterium]
MTLPLALMQFVFAGLFSPGPNVILLTTSGARFGFRQTLPHVLGVTLGVGITAGLTGLGLGALLLALPQLTLALKLIAAGWILTLAVQLFRSTRTTETTTQDRPFTFLEALLFQWVNPKVWAVAFAASAFVSEQGPLSAGLTLALTFSGINLGVCLFWSSAGHLLRKLLSNERIWRGFMTLMSLLMASSAALIFL